MSFDTYAEGFHDKYIMHAQRTFQLEQILMLQYMFSASVFRVHGGFQVAENIQLWVLVSRNGGYVDLQGHIIALL